MTGESLHTMTVGGGCFWCTEAFFQQLSGVKSVVSGYSGGVIADPTYEAVCAGTTGHAEVIQITFDPESISFVELLEVFFATHDPTTLNRQGNDSGTQYRSVIFYHDDEQKLAADRVIADLNESGEFSNPIVTEVSPSVEFYAAEDYHQNYYRLNSQQPYCSAVIGPKIAKLKSRFASKLDGATT